MQDVEKNNWIILEFIWNNSDTFRELIQYYTLLVRVSDKQYWNFQRDTNTFRELIQYYTLLVRVRDKQYWNFQRDTTKQHTLFCHIKQQWHFCRVTTKQYYTHFSEFISHNTLLGSYYKTTILTPPELQYSQICSNNHLYKMTTLLGQPVNSHTIITVFIH